ncbi:MAG: hypothetical protein JXX28_04325 [Deltaproteobacteria bacterium]|nr:hypothetical protein [Deltaproteobacteria bacterium]
MKIRVDKIASCTLNVGLHHEVVLGDVIPARAGTVVVGRVLDSKAVYNKLEDVHGRMATVHRGDIIAGVLGAREAVQGYSGTVPSAVAVGDTLHLLNLGGIIGQCTSANPEVGPPARVEILGSVLRFPELGRRVGEPASIFPGPIAFADHLKPMPPVVMLVGTSMNAGKTRAASSLIRELTKRGLRVGAAKVTGVALRRDTLEMLDHGASQAVSFADAGLPSTCAGGVLEAARGCLNALADEGHDLLVIELGDGLLGEYGVSDILEDPEFRALGAKLVLAAADPVAAWGGVKFMEQMGHLTTVVTGPATDNASGSRAVRTHTGVCTANARTQAEALVQVVLDGLCQPLEERL